MPLPGMNENECLDQFHDRSLVLSSDEQSSKSTTVDQLVRFLHQQKFLSRHSVAMVVKGGSLGKGTPIKGKSDIDLVVYLNGFSGMEEFKRIRSDILRELETKAKTYHAGGLKDVKLTEYSVQGKFNGEDLDILPTIETINTGSGKGAAYNAMARAFNSQAEAQAYSASLSPLQIDFVSGQNETVKRVIRLVKYWKAKRGVNIRSYTAELVTIYADRKGYGRSTRTLFEAVMTLLKDAESLKVAFDDNYSSQQYTSSMRPPYVLDPANPFKDTLENSNIHGISKSARETLALCQGKPYL